MNERVMLLLLVFVSKTDKVWCLFFQVSVYTFVAFDSVLFTLLQQVSAHIWSESLAISAYIH
jgi:hypothetical protein